MAPQAKKKQPQSSTLLSFFSAESAQKTKDTKSRSRRSSKSKTRARPSDIIVISDDDEVDASPAPAKRPRRQEVEEDDEVEVVDYPRPSSVARVSRKLSAASNRRAPNARSSGSNSEPTPGPSRKRERSPSVSLDADEGFGRPSLLLSSLPSDEAVRGEPIIKPSSPAGLRKGRTEDDSVRELAASVPSPGWGAPSSLLREPSLASGEPSTSHSADPAFPNSALVVGSGTDCTPPPPGELMDVDERPEVGDDVWEMGDDEMAFNDPAGESVSQAADDSDDFEVEIVDNESGFDAISSCPICERKISPKDVEAHVNACLNSTTSPSHKPEHSPASTSKPLRPLSSISPPNLSLLSSPALASRSFSPCPALSDTKGDAGGNAFSVLMTSFKENEAWKEASVVEDRAFKATKANGGRRKAPFYKVLQGMPIAVDAFRYGAIPGVEAYFLTHAHSDHYTNLSSNWKHGPIYCSDGTANLIMHMLGVDRKWVHPLPMDVATVIPNTGGVSVTPIEANHCPGSCIFLFAGRQTVDAGDSAYKSPFVGSPRTFRYLHCGDFRACPQHVLHPAVRGKRIDHVYLDTTYLDPKYCFPPQPQVISACAELAKRLVQGVGADEETDSGSKAGTVDGWFSKPKPKGKAKDGGNVLVVVGTYSIGKERIVKAIANALQTKVYCDARKTAILKCQADPELHAMLTTKPLEAGVHLVPLGVVASDRLKDYMSRWKGHFRRAIAFRPTGWTYTPPSGTDTLPSIPSVLARAQQQRPFTHAQMRPMRNSSAALQLYGVPYSEHSSFLELTCFALSLDWGRMIATVNVGSENSRKKMDKWVEKWDAERKKPGVSSIVPYRKPDYW